MIFIKNSKIKLKPAQPITRKYITVEPSATKFAAIVSDITRHPRMKSPVLRIGTIAAAAKVATMELNFLRSL